MSSALSAWVDKYFHVARVAQVDVSFLILSKDSIVLLFYYFIWYWFKVGRQFVVTTLVEQNVISFSNISVLCRLLALCILCRSFPLSSLLRRSCQWASVILLLGMVTLGSFSEASTR